MPEMGFAVYQARRFKIMKRSRFDLTHLYEIRPRKELRYFVLCPPVAWFWYSFQFAAPPSNQPIKPTAPNRMNATDVATDPARGLSLSR